VSDDDKPAPVEWTFTLLALITVPAWIAMAWYWHDTTALLAGAACQLFGIYQVFRADWR
jgi:hypothetical protein